MNTPDLKDFEHDTLKQSTLILNRVQTALQAKQKNRNAQLVTRNPK